MDGVHDSKVHFTEKMIKKVTDWMIYATTDTGKACPAVKYGNAPISTVGIVHSNKGDGVCSFCAMFESNLPQ